MQKRVSFPVRRLVLNAMLIALYVLLGFWKIPIGNMLRINLASFAVVVCAVAFSPIDGLIVGFMGEFLSQILGPYGMTPTTALWAYDFKSGDLYYNITSNSEPYAVGVTYSNS